MSTDFTQQPTKKMEEIVRRASTLDENGKLGMTFEELKQSLRFEAGLESPDDATYRPRDPSDPLFRRETPQQVEQARPVVSVPEPAWRTCQFYRVVYPHGNVRVELEGTSNADLDDQEKRIRAAYAA